MQGLAINLDINLDINLEGLRRQLEGAMMAGILIGKEYAPVLHVMYAKDLILHGVATEDI